MLHVDSSPTPVIPPQSGQNKPAYSGDSVHICDVLVRKGLLSPDQAKIVRLESQKYSGPVEEVILRLGFVSAQILSDILTQVSGFSPFHLTKTLVDPWVLSHFPKERALAYKVFPFSLDQGRLNVAMADIYDIHAIDLLRQYYTPFMEGSLDIIPYVATSSDVYDAIQFYYGYEFSPEALLKDLEGMILNHPASEEENAVVRFVNAIIFSAVSQNASDVHFEPEESFLRIRFRRDGLLQQICVVHRRYSSALIVRLKVMADMDIGENRRPQGGRMTAFYAGREIDFRFSAHPTLFGESLVIRILDKPNGILPLTRLGLPERSLHTLIQVSSRPQGMILLTGPTGSGKTTTLYSLLNHLNTPQTNIMTLEDPIEYELPLIRQTEIKEKGALTFAEGIRSILRQDPDIILVGEMRDQETAAMALRAAMTGHLVFSTLHTADVFGVARRLIDLGLTPRMVAGNLVCLLSQRLIRKLCPHCKQLARLKEDEGVSVGLERDKVYKVYRPVGCVHCFQTGYRGRTMIAEIVVMNEELEEALIQGVETGQQLFKEKALKQGFQPLSHSGIELLLAGEISLPELRRVCPAPLRGGVYAS